MFIQAEEKNTTKFLLFYKQTRKQEKTVQLWVPSYDNTAHSTNYLLTTRHMIKSATDCYNFYNFRTHIQVKDLKPKEDEWQITND